MQPLDHLPVREDWAERLARLPRESTAAVWDEICELAKARLDFPMTLRLDRAAQSRFPAAPPDLQTKPVRLAFLGSSSLEHLVPGIRVAGFRRGLWIETHLGNYGQYRQELADPASALHAFAPDTVLFCFDAEHLFADGADVPRVLADLQVLWDQATKLGAQMIQQTVLPRAPALIGLNEHRLAQSLLNRTLQLNERLPALADSCGVHLLTIDKQLLIYGLDYFYDPVLWLKAKQEISPAAGPAYGAFVARILAAAQGRSAKCLVLDLDNTLWSGVIGDDGLEGLKLGQGSATGEAFLAMQRYALDLSHRGIVLAVCSKNDEANALLPFEKHPEMLLKRSDIACFVANWKDKAANLRDIAQTLNLGLDSFVFVDDNPFEREQVRLELPMVSVPELPEDPALFPRCLAQSGYFESLAITPEDLDRTEQYRANQRRLELQASSSDMPGYLASLQMELRWGAFTQIDLTRIVQLINKTNQFNLRTQRYSEPDITRFMAESNVLTLQMRLVDRYGDNGIIGIVVGTPLGSDLFIDTWLMSCRVLGRGVEQATLALICAESKRLGFTNVVGEYRPTAKNGMVADHYPKLGFSPLESAEPSVTRWMLNVTTYKRPQNLFLSFAPSL